MNKLLNFATKHKILVIIVFIVIIGVLIFFLYPVIKYYGSTEFNSSEYGISFKLPKNWEQIKNDDLVKYYNSAAKLGFKKNDSANASFVIKIDDYSGKKNFDIAGSMEEIKKIFASKLEDFDLHYMRESTFKGMPCIETEYIYSLRTDITGGKQKTEQKQIIFLKNEKLYWLIFASYPQDFEKDSKDFSKIIETFEVK